jgi:hypothetical protein
MSSARNSSTVRRVSVLYPPQRHLPAKLRAFIDFLA